MKKDTDDESECGDAKNSEQEKPQKADIEFKCEEYEFVGNTNISVKKHVNTNHAPLLMVDNDKDTEIIEECIEDFFQIELMESKNVYACNVCNEGFDRDDKVYEPYNKQSQRSSSPNQAKIQMKKTMRVMKVLAIHGLPSLTMMVTE